MQRRHSLILLAAVLMTALLLSFVLRGSGRQDALTVSVTVDGAEVLRVPLARDGRYLVTDGVAEKTRAQDLPAPGASQTADADRDLNLIVVENGSVRCGDANCPNRICVRTQALSEDNPDASVICLPHRLSIQLVPE